MTGASLCLPDGNNKHKLAHLGRHFRVLRRVHLRFHSPRPILEVDEALQLSKENEKPHTYDRVSPDIRT